MSKLSLNHFSIRSSDLEKTVQFFSEVLEEYLDERDRQNGDFYDNRYIGDRVKGRHLMEDLGNPIKSFVEDALVLNPTAKVRKEDVFACFKHWALKKSMPPGTEQAFKRRFLAATQDQAVRSEDSYEKGQRVHLYLGVALNEKAQKYVDSIETFDEGVF